MSFSSTYSQPNPLTSVRNRIRSQAKLHKKKNIKKNRKKKSYVQVGPLSQDPSLLSSFVAHHAQQYFRLTKEDAMKGFLSSFRSSVHIKDIIGRKEDVFRLGEPHISAQLAQRYIRLCNQIRHGRLIRLKLSSKRWDRWTTCILKQGLSKQSPEVALLTSDEGLLMRKRAHILLQVDQFLEQVIRQRPELFVDQISRQLIALCKLNTVYENQLEAEVRMILARKEDALRQPGFPCQHSEQLQDRYCRILVMKNLRQGLSGEPLDYINYFREADIHEQSPYDDSLLPLLDSTEQLRHYLRVKKPKANKSEELSLKTACAACTSNCSQIYNPLVRCPECGIRTHRLCQTFRTKCNKCTYTRKTIEEKQGQPYCCLCLRDKEHGLSLQILRNGSQQSYAHTFCLLITQNWEVVHQKVVYSLPQLSFGGSTCKVCQRQGGVLLPSKCCQFPMHPLCAFLEGYSMSLPKESPLEIRCCDCAEGKRVSFDRHFRLNFCKVLYKGTEEVFNTIQLQ